MIIIIILLFGKKQDTEYITHFKKKCSCSSSDLQWCTGMLPLQCGDGQSLVQLVNDT